MLETLPHNKSHHCDIKTFQSRLFVENPGNIFFHSGDFMNYDSLPIEKLLFFYLDIYTPIDYLPVPS